MFITFCPFVLLCYLNNHLDSWQGGGQVLWVRGSDSHWDTASIQAAIESGNQVDSCKKNIYIIMADDDDWTLE